MKKVHLIVGARPNFMKMAPLYREFEKFPEEFEVKLIHTGQHYDEKMSKVFFDELKMPVPHEYLEVGSGSHGVQTARIMERYEEVLLKDKPDLVIVAGDVNSTVACALDAVKLHIPVAHLEAGLRSCDNSMPEEINRLITDSISQYLLTPSLDGNEHLKNEGVADKKVFFVGNIMIDSLVNFLPEVNSSDILDKLNIKPQSFVLITLHRPSNVDVKDGLKTILDAFEEISKDIKLIFPIHPRTRKRIDELGFHEKVSAMENLILLDPIGYYDFVRLQKDAKFILTDSGGIQEESTFLGVQCLTLRPNTERPVTITEGTNRLIELKTEAIIEEAQKVLKGEVKEGKIPEKWDGKTAERTVELFRNIEIRY